MELLWSWSCAHFRSMSILVDEPVNSSVDDMVLEAMYGYDGIPPKNAKAIQEDFRCVYYEI